MGIRETWLVMVLACAASACGKSGLESFADDYCSLVEPCCKAAGLKGDGQQCRQIFEAFGTLGSFDKSAANDCLEQARAASTQPDFCDGRYEPEPCNRVITSKSGGRGSKKPGEPCEDDDDCAASPEGEVECASTSVDGMTVQKCQLQIKGKAGDKPCVATIDGSFRSLSGSFGDDIPRRAYLCDVADGLRCSDDDACVRIAAVGEACTSAFDSYACTTDGRCDDSANKCVARAAEGSACTPSLRDECVQKAYCDAASKTCTATRPAGTACDVDDQCASRTCVNGKCGTDSLSSFGLQVYCGDDE